VAKSQLRVNYETENRMRSNFDYHCPDCVEDAVRMKCDLGSESCFWAGGTDLILQWKSEKIKPLHCIDLTAIAGLAYINSDESVLRIGGLTRLTEIERVDRQDPYLRTLADVARLMATPQTRTLATIAGNLCNASPAGDLIPTLIAMGAYLKVVGEEGSRELTVEALMTSPGNTSLHHSELVTEICIPTPSQARASSYRRIDRTVVDIALVSAAGAIRLDSNNVVESATLAMGAVAPTVIRSARAEAMLMGTALSTMNDEFIQRVGDAAAEDTTPISDVRASAEYRRAMIKVLVRRVLEDISRTLSGEPE
jgi:carbon-monoxide dehydrogenase medium subunit